MRLLFTVFILPVICSQLWAAEPSDITVTDKVVVQRCMIPGPSTRMIAVGHPGGFNFAFDAVHCSPSYAWFGDFVDFRGEITGRGGNKCRILGLKQSLAIAKTPFRSQQVNSLPKAVVFEGYKRSKKSAAPTFLFKVDGVSVEQKLSSPQAGTILIELNFPQSRTSSCWYHLDPASHNKVTLGTGLRWSEAKVIEIPANLHKALITITLKKPSKTFTREKIKQSGAQVFALYCNSCHATDDSKLIGPSFKGLFGRRQSVIRNGKEEEIITDEAYLLESIMKPQAAVVKGFEQVPMADFSKALTKEQLQKLMDYLKTL